MPGRDYALKRVPLCLFRDPLSQPICIIFVCVGWEDSPCPRKPPVLGPQAGTGTGFAGFLSPLRLGLPKGRLLILPLLNLLSSAFPLS